MSHLPRDPNPDSTLALLSQGYTYISRRCRHFQSDVFKTRIMFYPAVCMFGEEAARLFYEPDRFTRRRAKSRFVIRNVRRTADPGARPESNGLDLQVSEVSSRAIAN